MKTRINPKTCSAVILSLGLSITAWSQTSIPIDNPSFESPVLDPGQFVATLVDWTVVGPPSVAGTVYPAAFDYPGGAPDGNNIAYVNASADGDGIGQVLTATLKPGTQYNLSVEVGNNGVFLFEGYRVQLLAGGVILAEDDNTLNPANGTFATSTVTYSYDAVQHEALLGESLEIRLLSKAQVEGETNFDNAQLTVAFSDPVADAGGPYTVFPDDALQLDGSGSVPPDGATITTYEWDLNNDGIFGDVTGAMPTAISFSDLIDVWGMESGLNTIQLRITDSDSNTSTVSTTVNLQDGLVILISDTTPAGGPIELFFTGNFDNVAEIRHGDFANFSAPATQDALLGTGVHEGNGPANVVVIGRRLSSAAYSGGAADGYNALEIPFINFTSYTARQDDDRLGWHASGSTGGNSIAGDETTVTSAGASIFGLVAGTYDLFSGTNNFNGLGAGTTAFGGGEILATIGGDTLAAYWAPGTAPGNTTNAGVDTFPGPRLLFNLDQDGDDNFTNLTENGLTALINAIDFATPLSAVVIPPEIASLDPETNAVAVYPGIDQLVVTFTRPIALTGVGTVTIQNLGDVSGSSDTVINLPDASITVADEINLVITLASNLDFNTAHAIQISGDAVTDLDGTPFAGIDDSTTWTFTTVEENTVPPAIIAKSPEHEATGVGTRPNIVATFDQNLILDSGDIVIKDLEDNTTTQTISVNDDARVSVEENVLTIIPDVLGPSRAYAVQIPATAVRNFSDVNFVGITNDTDWNFTTGNLASQLGILDLAANGGINPATNQGWNAGDRYRLVFISSDRLNARDTDFPSPFGSWDSINTWNAEAQNFAHTADGQDLTGITWKVLGSTPTVNARDNTATNPLVNGSGHPIMLIDGETIIAGDFEELWGGPGSQIRSVINLTENVIGGLNQTIGEAPSIPWPLTGTNVSGVNLGAGGSLRNIQAGGSIRQGEGSTTQGWIDRANRTVQAATTGAMAIYVISDPLFVIDLDDNVNPELVSIVDDVGGGPVGLDDEPVINYTVTFNEAMLPASVDASDFGNAGSAGFTINSVVQAEDPAEFLVTVTPTSEGTLQLQINESALLTDLNGNPLDTSFALLDDTIIEVMAATATGYGVWAGGFPGLTDTDPTLDFDGGGLATALEWVLGGDPTDPSDDATIVPTIDNTSDPEGKLLFTFRRNIDAENDADTTIIVEYSTDLVAWTAAAHQGAGAGDVTISVVPNGFGAGIDEVTVALPPALGDGGKLFVRLNVEVANTPPAE